MAELRLPDQTVVVEPEKIQNILKEEGILYEEWGLRDGDLSDSKAVLSVYKEDIQRLKDDRGYVEQDVIAINPDTQGIEDALKNFKRQHVHTDDEVRFVVDGCGIFFIFSDDGEKCYQMMTKAGDLIVIPANKKHAFELTEERSIRCIRLFTNDQGWKAIYT